MYIPKRIRAINFQSFQELDYTFQQGKAIPIEGANLTDEGQESNGSGKSGFGEILYYALIGSSSTNKRDIKLVTWGEKESTIIFELENHFYQHTLEIERHLFSNTKPSTLQIRINGEDQKHKFSSVPEGNKFILSLLDISADDLKNYYLINGDRFVSFFSNSDTAKRALIGRFSSADRMAVIDPIIEERSKKPKAEIERLQRENILADGKVAAFEEQIEEEKFKYSDEAFLQRKSEKEAEIQCYTDRIEKLDIEVNNCVSKIAEAEIDHIKYSRIYSVYEKAKQKMESFNYDTLIADKDREIQKCREKIQAQSSNASITQTEKTEYEILLNPLEVEVAGAVTCPSCKFVFAPQSNVNIKEAKELIPIIKSAINEFQKKIEGFQQKAKDIELKEKRLLEAELQALKNQKIKRDRKVSILKALTKIESTNIDSCRRDADNEKDTKARKVTEKTVQESYKKTAETELKNMKKIAWQNSFMDEIQKKIDEQNEIKENLKERIEGQEQILRNIRQWGLRMQQFYIYLTNKSLSIIQGYCNMYLNKIHTNLQLKLEGFKTLSDGKTIKENITPIICRDGLEEEDYRCFSGGEKDRLIFSTILTFQHLVNQKSKSGGLDLICVDEVFGRTDPMGMRLFIESLQDLEKTVLLISQVQTNSEIVKPLIISKENGLSVIK